MSEEFNVELEKYHADTLASGQLIFGNPVELLINSFNALYPDINVRLVYLPHLGDIIEGMPRLTTSELGEVFVGDDTCGQDDLSIENRDDSTGISVGLVKRNSFIFILIDYDTTSVEVLYELLEILPKLVSSPGNELETGDYYTYKVTQRRLQVIYDAVLEDFHEEIFPRLISYPQIMSALHVPLPIGVEEGGDEEDDQYGELV
jgi:hypothetical protein